MKEYFVDNMNFSNHIKSDTREEVESELSQIPVPAGNETLVKGNKSNLGGYFNIESAEYVGFDSKRKMIVFYLGKETTLFESKHYYQTFFYINDKRLAIATMERCMSDFKFINGKWK